MTVQGYDPVAAFTRIKSAKDAAEVAVEQQKAAVRAAKIRLIKPIQEAIAALDKHYDIVLDGDYGKAMPFELPSFKDDSYIEWHFANKISHHSVKVYAEGETPETLKIVVVHHRAYPYKSDAPIYFTRWIDAYEKAVEIYMQGVKSITEKKK